MGVKNAKSVCRDWLQGRCTNDTCDFVHTDLRARRKLRNLKQKNNKSKKDPTSIQEAATMSCKTLAKLQGHTKAITGISLQGDMLYSSGKDRTLRIWDCNNGRALASATIDGEIGCLVADGPWLFAGLKNGVKAWDFGNHTEFFVDGPGGLVTSMVMNGDFDRLIAGMEDGTILMWKWRPTIKNFEAAAMAMEHKGAVSSLVVGGERLYSGSRDTTIKVWDLQSLRCLQTLEGHTKDVTSVLCWDAYLLSASLDNTLKVWAATERGITETVCEMKHNHAVITLRGIHDAEAKPILLCSIGDKTVRLYDPPSFTERGRIRSKGEIHIIQIGVNGLFFTGDASGEVSVWKLQ